jgi:hypothetical protein
MKGLRSQPLVITGLVPVIHVLPSPGDQISLGLYCTTTVVPTETRL